MVYDDDEWKNEDAYVKFQYFYHVYSRQTFDAFVSLLLIYINYEHPQTQIPIVRVTILNVTRFIRVGSI